MANEGAVENAAKKAGNAFWNATKSVGSFLWNHKGKIFLLAITGALAGHLLADSFIYDIAATDSVTEILTTSKDLIVDGWSDLTEVGSGTYDTIDTKPFTEGWGKMIDSIEI